MLQSFRDLQVNDDYEPVLIDGIEINILSGLPVTGELDRMTVKLMKQPRCGVKDDVGKNMGSSRSKRFALQGSRWKVNTLLYKISKYPTNTNMSRSDIILKCQFSQF